MQRRALSLAADLAVAMAIACGLTVAVLHWATPCAAGHLC